MKRIIQVFEAYATNFNRLYIGYSGSNSPTTLANGNKTQSKYQNPGFWIKLYLKTRSMQELEKNFHF
jgi:hypothetical protein